MGTGVAFTVKKGLAGLVAHRPQTGTFFPREIDLSGLSLPVTLPLGRGKALAILAVCEKKEEKTEKINKTALNNRLDVDQFVSQKGTSHDGQETIKINREELEKITNHYFARKSTYDRTREKLIGLTIPYNISVEESFDAIISKYITDEPTKVLIKENKEKNC